MKDSDSYLFFTLKQVLYLFSFDTIIAIHLNDHDFPIDYKGTVKDLLSNDSYRSTLIKFGEVYQIQIIDSTCHIFLF